MPGPATITHIAGPDGYETGASVSVDITPGESTAAILTTSLIDDRVSGNNEESVPDIGNEALEDSPTDGTPEDLACGSSNVGMPSSISDGPAPCSDVNEPPVSPASEPHVGEDPACPDNACAAPGPASDDTASIPSTANLPGPRAMLANAPGDPYSWTAGNFVLSVEPPANLEVLPAGSTILIPVTVLNVGDYQRYLTVLLTSTSSSEDIPSGLGTDVWRTVDLPFLLTADHVAAGAVLVPGITILDMNGTAIASTPAFSFPIGTPETTTEITLDDIQVIQATCEDGLQPPRLVLPQSTDQVTYSATPDKEAYEPGDVVTVTASWDVARFTVADYGSWEPDADTPGVASQTVSFLTVPCPGLLIEIEPSSATYSFADEVIRYDIIVTNTGNTTFSNLRLDGSDTTLATLIPDQRQVLGSRSYTTTNDDLTGQSDVSLSATVSGTVEETSESFSATGTSTLRYIAAGRVDLETPPSWDEAICTDGVLTPPVLRLPADTETIRFSASDAGPYAPGQSIVVRATTVGTLQFGTLSHGWELDESDVNRTVATYTIRFVDMPCQAPVKATIEVDVSVVNKQLEYGVDATISYAITVANTGTVPLSDVIVSSSLADDLACDSDTVEPGKTIACTASYIVSQADIDAGTPIVNTVSVTGTAPDGATKAAASGSDSVNVVEALPALSLSLSADPVRVNAAGQEIAYTFTITNSGNVTVTSLAIDAPLLAGAARPITCDATELAPGRNTECRGAFVVDQAGINAGGSIDVSATVTGRAPDARVIRSSQVTATVPIDREPGMTLSKVATSVFSSGDSRMIESGQDARDLTAGDVVTYRLEATNTGNVTLDDVIISDAALSGLHCGQPATLAPGESLTCEGEYTFTEDDATLWNGVVRAAGVTAQAPGSGNVTASASATMWPAIPEPVLTIEIAADRTTYSRTNEVISFAATVTNAGTVPLSNLQVSAPALAGGLACDLPATLESQASIICTGRHTILQADLDTGSFSVQADVTGEGLEGKHASATHGLTVTAVQNPALGLTMSVSMVNDVAVSEPVSGLKRGDVTTYALVATNTGNVSLEGVTIADTLSGDSGLECEKPATLLPGSSLPCTLRRTITQEDIDRGVLTGDATATAITPAGAAITRDATSTVRMEEAVPGIAFVASASPSEAHRAGETITWSFAVTNTGNVTIGDLAIQTSMFDAAAITCPQRSVAPGETRTCTASSTITQDHIDYGDALSTEASATGYAVRAGSVTARRAPVDPRLVSSASSIASVRVVQAPALTMTGKASTPPGEQIRRGTVVTIEFVVTNTGNTTVRDVIIEDVALISVFNGGSGPLTVGTLAPGDSRVVRGTVVLPDAILNEGVLTDIAIATNGGVRSPEVALKLPLIDPSQPTPTPTTPANPTPTPPVRQTPTPGPTSPSLPEMTPTPAPQQETPVPSPTDPAQPAPTVTPEETAPSVPGRPRGGEEGTPQAGRPDGGDMEVDGPEITGLPSTGQATGTTVIPVWGVTLMAALVLLAAGFRLQRGNRG